MFDVFIWIRSLPMCPSCILMSMVLIGRPLFTKSIYTSAQPDIYFYPDKENSCGLIYFAKDGRQKINNHEDTKIIVSSDHQSACGTGLDRTQKHGRVTEQQMTLTIRRTQSKMAAAFWQKPLKRIIDKGYSLCKFRPACLSGKILLTNITKFVNNAYVKLIAKRKTIFIKKKYNILINYNLFLGSISILKNYCITNFRFQTHIC